VLGAALGYRGRIMKDDFLDQSELAGLGLGAVGRAVSISRRAVFFAPERITVGDHTRIDAFSILSAGEHGIGIGRNVHVSAYACMLGEARIEVGDFAALSVRCTILSSNDDYSGASMVNPTVPEQYRGVISAPVTIGTHAVVGTAAIVLPGVTIGESACVGAASFVRQDVPPFKIVAGVPSRVIGERLPGHREVAEKLLSGEAEP
jgi:acetyltransferase-like isoleucine patch superfamily enzyme